MTDPQLIHVSGRAVSAACAYLSRRCRWPSRLWSAAASAGTQSRRLWRPGAAAAPRSRPAGGEAERGGAVTGERLFQVSEPPGGRGGERGCVVRTGISAKSLTELVQGRR